MTTTGVRRRLAADVLLLAARGLPPEFTEWDLSVAAWNIDPSRFGLRGHAALHPDHKRAACELVKIVRKWRAFERLRPGVYALTDLGRAAADRVAAGGVSWPRLCGGRGGLARLRKAAAHPAFSAWLADCGRPDDPADVREFERAVGCGRPRLAALIAAVPAADRGRYADLADFLTAMAYRFGEG